MNNLQDGSLQWPEEGWQNSLTYEVQLFMVIESVDTLRDLELGSKIEESKTSLR